MEVLTGDVHHIFHGGDTSSVTIESAAAFAADALKRKVLSSEQIASALREGILSEGKKEK